MDDFTNIYLMHRAIDMAVSIYQVNSSKAGAKKGEEEFSHLLTAAMKHTVGEQQFNRNFQAKGFEQAQAIFIEQEN